MPRIRFHKTGGARKPTWQEIARYGRQAPRVFSDAPEGWWQQAERWVVSQLPRLAGGASVQKREEKATFPMCTDMGNAERLVRRAAKRMRYVNGLGWLAWDGKRWLQDTREQVLEEAKVAVRGIYGEAEKAEDDALRKKLSNHAVKSEATKALNAMIAQARSNPRLRLRDVEQLDSHDHLLNVQNGVLDLDTLELQPKHDPDQLLTKITAASYDPDARCDFWEETVEYFIPDEDTRRWVQKAAGYSLGGSYSEFLFLLWGLGENGKSTILDGLRFALGDYAIEAATDLLMQKDKRRSAGDEAALADLRGARLVTTTETSEGRKLAESFLKKLTGESRLKAKFMRENHFEFQNRAAIWMATNHKPTIQGTDHGIWRRLPLIPFEQTLAPGQKLDEDKVKAILHAGADGIFRWMVDGRRMYQEEGLEPFPELIATATAKYRADMDSLKEWFDDHCTPGKGKLAAVARVRESYDAWCKSTGHEPISAADFNERLGRLGYERRSGRPNGGKVAKCWHGFEIAR